MHNNIMNFDFGFLWSKNINNLFLLSIKLYATFLLSMTAVKYWLII